jgi:hypothetical protein
MNSFLIIVSGLSKNGKISTTLSTYPEGNPVPATMSVVPGDRLSWYVQIGVGGAPRPLPYSIHFFEADGKTPDTHFFGVSSLSVPVGGTSQFVHVRSLQQTIKYSISVPGLGTILDPLIQTGDGMIPVAKDVAGSSSYAVTWDMDTNDMSYSKNGGVAHPFPATLQIKYGDKMGFTAISGQGGAPDIQVIFTWDGITNWASPFLQEINTMPATPVNPIPLMQVKDPGDHYSVNHGVFPFVLQPANGTPSSSFNLTLL